VIGGNGLSWTTNAQGQAQIYVRLSAPGTYQIAPVIDINGNNYQGQSFSVSVSGTGSLWNNNGNFYFYSPSQVNQAYNALPTIQQGQGARGITIANIIEGVPTMGNPWGQSWTWSSDLLNYAQLVHQRVNFPQVVPVSGGASAFQYSQGWMTEGESDIERLSSAAPNANLLLYDAYTNSGLFSAVNKAIEQDQAKIVTMSWEGPNSPQGLFSMGVVEGMTFFGASGDMGPYANSPSLVMSTYPADSANVTGVGGTELALGLQGQVLSQGAWSPEGNNRGVPGASGGGYSRYVSEPTWQQPFQNEGNRGTPDVSLMAGFGWYTSYI
jgi:subtilase family serine protease